jgi:RNase_H superfamily
MMEQLLLSCGGLSPPALCRFIPALSQRFSARLRGNLEGVDGYFAVSLWNEYQRNKDPKALETLLAYNIQDVVNLETLMVLSYNLKLRETPFNESHQLDLPSSPDIPFKADLKTIEKVRRQVMESYWISSSRWSYPGYPTGSH